MALTKRKGLVSVPWNVIEPLTFKGWKKVGYIMLIRMPEALVYLKTGGGLEEKGQLSGVIWDYIISYTINHVMAIFTLKLNSAS